MGTVGVVGVVGGRARGEGLCGRVRLPSKGIWSAGIRPPLSRRVGSENQQPPSSLHSPENEKGTVNPKHTSGNTIRHAEREI